jgi:hypothetical protein
MNRTFFKIALMCVSLSVVAACTHYKLVPPSRVEIGDDFSVATDVSWNQRVDGKFETWTRDGPLIQEVRFVDGLEDDEALFKTPVGHRPIDYPPFKSTMNALEVREFYEATMGQAGVTNFQSTNLRPAKFGSHDGFRFDFSMYRKEGLHQKGMAAGALIDGKLYLVTYVAAALYYYDRDRPAFENIVKSVKFSK